MTTLVAERPAILEPAAPHYPEINRYRLANNLEIAACHMPGRPYIVGNVTFQRGVYDDPLEYAGATGLMAGLLASATTSRGFEELGLTLERLGAGVMGMTQEHVTIVGWDAPLWNFAEAFEVFADILRNPAFPQSELDKAIDATRTALATRHFNFPLLGGRTTVVETFSEDTLYQFDGGMTYESLERIDADHLRHVHRTMLETAPATLVISGDLDELDVDGLAASLGAAWAAPAPRGNPTVTARREGRRIVIIDRPGASQSIIYACHSGPPAKIDDPVTMHSFGHIFGSGPENRLNKVLREENGDTYGVTAGFTQWRHGGMFGINTSVDTPATAKSVGEIVRQLELIHADGVTSEELERSRQARIGGGTMGWHDPHVGAGYLGAVIENDLAPDQREQYDARLRNHTVEEVNTFIRHTLDLDNLLVVIVGDAAKIEPELEALAFGPITRKQPGDVFPAAPGGGGDGDDAPGGDILSPELLRSLPPEMRAQVAAQIPPEMRAQLPAELRELLEECEEGEGD